MATALQTIRKITSPVPLPWFRFMRKKGPMNEYRRHIFEQNLRLGREGGIGRRVRYGIRWPFISAVNAWRGSRDLGDSVRRAGGPTRTSQFLQAWWLSLSQNLGVPSYYNFRLWDSARRARAEDWLQDRDNGASFALLQPVKAFRSFEDKLKFHAHCRQLGLPTVPILAQISRRAEPQWVDAQGLPEADLFIKPADDGCGVGTARWSFDPATKKWSRKAVQLDEDSLLKEPQLFDFEHVKGDGSRLLIQPRIENHPALAKFSQGALCTMRIITYRIGNAQSRLFAAILRMPTGDAEIDNYSAGGLSSPLDSNGRLGPAWKKFGIEPVHRHPDSGAAITGAMIPQWQDLVGLALRAHDAIVDNSFIGWDVALSPEGPLLVEANQSWSVEHWEIAHDGPIVDSEFLDIIQRIDSCKGKPTEFAKNSGSA